MNIEHINKIVTLQEELIDLRELLASYMDIDKELETAKFENKLLRKQIEELKIEKLQALMNNYTSMEAK